MPKVYDVAPLPGHHPEIGLLLGSLIDSTREWRESLGEPSVDAIVWPCFPDGHSIGALLLHMIDCESYWFENFCAGIERNEAEVALWMSDEVDQMQCRWPVPPAEPFSWYVAELERVRLRAFRSIEGIDPGRVFKGRKHSFTFRWVVAHVLQHDSYTGGQAVLAHEAWKRSRSER